jgi:hypothetical protein
VSIPSVIVAIAVVLVVVIALPSSMLVLIVGVTMASRVAVAVVIVASLLVARHDGGVAIDRLVRAMLITVSGLADGTVMFVSCALSRRGGDAGESEVRLLPQPRLIHSIKLIDEARMV